MPFAAVRDLSIYYELHGEGPPLLLISGTGNDLRYSSPDLVPLNRSHSVCHFDQRGLGQTQGPERAYSMADYADDAAGLLDHLGWDTARVLGISFGGMVAQHLAARHPDRIERMVLACTSSGGTGRPSADLLALHDLPTKISGPLHLKLLDNRFDPQSGELPPGLRGFIRHRAKQPELTGAAAAGARRQLEARAGHDIFDELPEVTAPTLVIGGRYDGIAPPENLQAIVDQLPNARLELREGGHLFMIQDPDSWDTMLSFLAEAD